MANSLEAKIVVLGSQGVGKTSLVHRYIKNAFAPPTTTSTVGASFLTKRVVDIDTSTIVRLQIWDTAGQERFRSISKLYYRGAQAAILCYDITDEKSFDEMGRWLRELKANSGDDMILHVVGTKSDVVGRDPSRRQVPFERCIAYVAENLYPDLTQHKTTHPNGSLMNGGGVTAAGIVRDTAMASPPSNRSSGFWGGDIGWDCCHEISARDGEGVEEVFRVITRKLVEQRNRQLEMEHREFMLANGTPGVHGGFYSSQSNGSGVNGYFDYTHGNTNGSFRVGAGDKRRSWLGLPITPGTDVGEYQADIDRLGKKRGGKCC